MAFRDWLKVTICLVMTAVLSAGVLQTVSSAEDATEVEAALVSIVSAASPVNGYSMGEYAAMHEDAVYPAEPIVINALDYADENGSGFREEDLDGLAALLLDASQRSATWRFFVENEGFYNLAFLYQALPGKTGDIELRLLLDGTVPYKNAEIITLPRWWRNATPQGERFAQDEIGNEIRPKQIEITEWRTHTAIDSHGQYREPLVFFLEKGAHELTLDAQTEYVALNEIRFTQADTPESYEATLTAWDNYGAKDSSGFFQVYEGELADEKNAVQLFPTYDRARESMSPSHYKLMRYNTVGRDTWDKAGQALYFQVNVPADGYYLLSFKVKQNAKRGMFSTRAVLVDGQTPYAELGNIRFKNHPSWYIATPSDAEGNPYKLYLTAGSHEIAFTATLGDEADVLRQAEQLVAEMNAWYRKIIVVTGSNADSSRISIDLNRDFLLDKKIPGLIEAFDRIAGELEQCVQRTNELYGKGGNAGTVMAELAQQLRVFVGDPDKIPARLENFRGSVGAMATWVLEMRAQPLEMDYFALYSPDRAAPVVSGSWYKQMIYRAGMFLASFSADYDALGSTDDSRGIDIWISTSDLGSTGISSGRDQAQVIKLMIDEMFTPQTGIPVNVSLVNSSTVLVQAVLAGKGPDAALVVSKDTPVNLAMRNAVMPLEEFEGYPHTLTQFMPSAVVPYQFEGHTYALPETQSFDMLFYRKDIFEELGLSVPTDWHEFYYVVSVLQQNNLLTGIPENQRTFEALLYQKGTQFYTNNLTQTTFDEPAALEAFRQWTGLYAKYSLPLVFDFFNRFRSGEMPMAIMPYTQCNYLAAAAPELRGLWDFAPIPGTMNEEGRLNRSETASGTACVMLKKDSNPQYEDVFAFLSWWVGSEAQARFGSELENLMGAAARYPTANIDAFEQLPWNAGQARSLRAQWAEVVEIPQIPGSYYIARNVSFAFRAVVYNYANEREALYKYNKEINKEIMRKRLEFKLPV